MIIPVQVLTRRIGKYELYGCRILVLQKTCCGDSTDRIGHFILLFKNIGLMLRYQKVFISLV